MIKKTKNGDHIIWQEVHESIPEPAILIEAFSDVISIEQEGRYINLNYENVEELSRLLRRIAKERT